MISRVGFDRHINRYHEREHADVGWAAKPSNPIALAEPGRSDRKISEALRGIFDIAELQAQGAAGWCAQWNDEYIARQSNAVLAQSYRPRLALNAAAPQSNRLRLGY